jgi:hypothetical protein
MGFFPSFGSGETKIVARKFSPRAGMGDVASRNFQRIKHLISEKDRPKSIWPRSFLGGNDEIIQGNSNCGDHRR